MALSPSIFKAYDIRGIVDGDPSRVTLTDEAVRGVGAALGLRAQAAGIGSIVVGRDGRLSGPRLVAALIEGINSAGVDLTALTVLTGAIVFGLGFGIRDITANFVSGFVLLMDKSIKPGDVISFTQHTGTTSENFGWVQELRGRYVVVRDRDGVESLVPNQNLITTSVINWSYSDQRVRLRLPVMISYDDDPELALQLLVKAASDHPRILRDPEPVSRLLAFENYGIRLESRFWIRDPMNGVNNVRSDVNRRIWKLFKEAGIKIPVAQQEVRVLGPVGEHADPRG